MLNEHLYYAKLGKLKAASEVKKQWLAEFQKTLENQQNNQQLFVLRVEEQRGAHRAFLEQMMKDKEYKRELYLAERLVDVMDIITP